MNGSLSQEELLALCGSKRWAELVAAYAPFANLAALHAAASDAFDRLEPDDWLEAFAHHPRIGDVESLRERFAASGVLSEHEQAGIKGAQGDVIEQIAAGNLAYEQRFGFVFLIRAAGRSAAEMLSAQRERLNNSAEQELLLAAKEQSEITHLRIDGLTFK